ncbi:MAM and LDL-receptor class A domain-containing protein 1-like [Lytechinus pictus]|uniref:MAM and LDL-receptor class A domain-containing protein 1-like n=1 Tax=Lytechinus pictus TaxID=7653 RepID=UPI0030BA04B5
MYPMPFVLFFVIASGVRAQLFTCDFENDICDLTSDTTATWSTVEAGVAKNPGIDHTYESSGGHYMYASLSSGQTARVITSDLPVTTNRKCTEFFIFMNGQSNAILNAYVRESGQPTPVEPTLTIQGDQGKKWVRALFTVEPQPTLFQIVIEGKNGEISIDDMSIVNGQCPQIDWTCTFEDPDICGMQQDKTDEFDFKRQNKKTGTWNTGPKHDHTYNNASGYYMYIEANGANTGHVARLISPLLQGTPDQTEPSCLIFWYDMFGKDVDSLNVYLTIPGDDGGFPGELVWSLAGNRGDQWRGAEVVVNTTEDFKIVFEATRGDTDKADIAIDDVEFDGFARCPGHNVLLNHSSISCTFEEIEICYYIQDTTDDYNWSWKNRGTPVYYTGPDVDHTRGDELGFFMLINPSNSKPIGAKARLISPPSSPLPDGGCLEFYYSMYGIDVETLNVYTKTEDQDLPGTQVWTKQGNQGNYWHRATFATPRDQVFQVVFEGVRGIESRDDIAIDDVFLYTDGPNSCPPKPTPEIIPPTPSASTHGFECGFEDDWCGFTQAQWDQGDWSRITPKTEGFQLNNIWDHTTRSPQGYIITFDPNRGKFKKNDRARIYSPMVVPSHQPRCLTYYYHMSRQNVDHMGFHIRNFNEPLPLDPVLSVFGKQPWGWHEQKYTIDPTDKYFQVCFYISVGPITWNSAIALDDISVQNGACEVVPTPTPRKGSCDFDNNYCGYTQSKKDNFDWTRRNGPTASLYTSPLTDHTTGTLEGYYMYTETSSGRRPGDVADLMSPQISGDHAGLCLQFFFYMYGRDIGFLGSYLLPALSSFRIALVEVSGDQGQRWFHRNVDIDPMPFETFQIVFRGVVGGGPRGDIAIDDITVFNHPCSGVRTESVCDFESGSQACGYGMANGMGDEWEWYDANVVVSPPVEEMDGSFMFSIPTPGVTVRLATPALDVRSGKQYSLSLDYQLFNDSKLAFAISIERENQTDNQMIFQLTHGVEGVVKGKWDVNTEDLGFKFAKIVFTASTTSSSQSGVVAIDNVEFKPQHPEMPTKSAPIINSYRGETIVLGVLLSVAIVAIIVVFIVILVRRSRNSDLLTIGYKNQKDDHMASNPVVINSGKEGANNGIDNPMYST